MTGRWQADKAFALAVADKAFAIVPDPNLRPSTSERSVESSATERMQLARGCRRSLSLSTCAALYLLPLVRGWTPPPAQLLHRRPAAAPRSLLVLSEAASVSACFTPDVNEDGINEEVGVRIAPSQGKGLGAYACRQFDEGSIVGDYTGESLTARDISARYDQTTAWNIDDHLWSMSREERGISTTGRYIYRIEDDLYIDAEDPAVASWARFINHSRDPNLMGKSLAKCAPHPHPSPRRESSRTSLRRLPPRATQVLHGKAARLVCGSASDRARRRAHVGLR